MKAPLIEFFKVQLTLQTLIQKWEKAKKLVELLAVKDLTAL
jgi:hypothetical protein